MKTNGDVLNSFIIGNFKDKTNNLWIEDEYLICNGTIIAKRKSTGKLHFDIYRNSKWSMNTFIFQNKLQSMLKRYRMKYSIVETKY